MLQEIYTGTGTILLYFIVMASAALIARSRVRIEDEVFRKLLHFILLGSLLVWTLVFKTWYLAAGTALAFAAAVYPFLKLAEGIRGYSRFVTERKSGELKQSLLIVFGMYALVAALCWGWQGDKLLALCSIYAWGVGDAAAALVGKRFGRHPLEGRHIEGRKSVEGSAAMFTASFICVISILLVRGGLPWAAYPFIAAVAAAVSAFTELYSMHGMDTITCPLAAAAVLIPLVQVCGGAL